MKNWYKYLLALAFGYCLAAVVDFYIYAEKPSDILDLGYKYFRDNKSGYCFVIAKYKNSREFALTNVPCRAGMEGI